MAHPAPLDRRALLPWTHAALRALPWVIGGWAVLAVTGCATTPPEPAVRGDVEAFARLATAEVVGTDHTLGVPDVVAWRSDRLPVLNASRVRIAADGTVEVPLLGRVPVVGLTLDEASAELSRRAAALDRRATVELSLVAAASRHVYVLGHVARPGAQTWKPGQTLLETVVAGGLLTNADAGRVEVVRPAADPTLRRRVSVDLERLTSAGDGSVNLVLDAGDVVIVPAIGEPVEAAWRWPVAAPVISEPLAGPVVVRETPVPVASVTPTPVSADAEPVDLTVVPESTPVSAPAAGTRPTPAAPVRVVIDDPFAPTEDAASTQPSTTEPPAAPRRQPRDVVFWN